MHAGSFLNFPDIVTRAVKYRKKHFATLFMIKVHGDIVIDVANLYLFIIELE